MMDLVLNFLDPLILDSLYRYLPPNFHQQDWWVRQVMNPSVSSFHRNHFMYHNKPGGLTSFSYVLLFDKSLRKHKRFLPKQELQEISVAMWSIPWMAVPSAFIFLAEARGWSQLYDGFDTDTKGVLLVAFNILFYLVFTDTLIYWIHKWLHHPLLYAPIHKLHHKWVISTPFASHAFHPIDGFLQSLPYHIYVFLFPLNKLLYIGLFIFVNFWTISIHDGSGFYAGTVLNGADHHTIHHRQFNYNYGQYFTFWDRVCGTHKLPVGKEIEKVVLLSEKPKGA